MRSLRKEMGEVKWKEYQRRRNILKVFLWRKSAKIKLIEYKGGECEICGYDKKMPSVYDFHHIDPEQKDFNIGFKGRTYSIARMKKEVDKCLLLCANCHREIHFIDFKKNYEYKKEELERFKGIIE